MPCFYTQLNIKRIDAQSTSVITDHVGKLSVVKGAIAEIRVTLPCDFSWNIG